MTILFPRYLDENWSYFSTTTDIFIVFSPTSQRIVSWKKSEIVFTRLEVPPQNTETISPGPLKENQ